MMLVGENGFSQTSVRHTLCSEVHKPVLGRLVKDCLSTFVSGLLSSGLLVKTTIDQGSFCQEDSWSRNCPL